MRSHTKRARKSFSACWTCRRRRVHCDGALPACAPCRKHCVQCEGYSVKLVWVDRQTGKYPPSSRRSLASVLTWGDRPVLGDEDLQRLIDIEYNQTGLQQSTPTANNPFNVFDACYRASFESIRSDTSETSQDAVVIANTYDAGACRAQSSSIILHGFEDTQTPLEEVSAPAPSLQIVHDDQERTPLSNLDQSAVDNPVPRLHAQIEPIINSDNDLALRQPNPATTTSVVGSPNVDQIPQYLIPCPTITATNSEDAIVFFHYMSWVAPLMVPVDSYQNPWKTIYPSTALQDTSTASRALYHAMMAEAAFNLANLYESNNENHRKRISQGLEHYGASMQRLRQCLSSPIEADFDAYMATLYTLTVTGVQSRRSLPWRHHFTGAQSLVTYFIREQPWKLSSRSWTICQSVALTFEVTQTSNFSVHAQSSLTDILFEDVSAHEQFGFTIGASRRSLQILSKVRLLIQHIATGDISTDVGERIQTCINELTAASDLDSNIDCFDFEARWKNYSRKVQSDLLMHLHERLFRDGILIYLYRSVLDVPPQGVVKNVSAVLQDALTFIRLQGGSISLWPVFIAAVEAYEINDQQIAEQCLDGCSRLGIGNRDTIRQVIHATWDTRVRKATKRGIQLGQTPVDWRKVQKKLGYDVMLL